MEANYLTPLGLGLNEIMHITHLTRSLAHTKGKILVVVDDDFLKTISRTVPSSVPQIDTYPLPEMLPFIPFCFSMSHVHGLHSEPLGILPLRISLGGTQNTYNGSYALHEPLSHML